ncbi:MAG: radical SAM family heme chaperone HemW [Coriobacteriales bacterium]
MIEALYLHIPFCVSRCAYCDFATSACDDDARMDAYVDALCVQLRRAARAGLLGQVKTIYIGGGTPTHLGSRRLNTLVYTISLSVNLENVVEFTCEANPESIDERMVADLFSLGVNRFSLGAQSFDDAVLAGYGRIHDAAAIDAALAAVRTRTNNVSLDLICGGPGQSMESWRQSLQHAIDADVAHVSIYPLILEDDTPLARRVEAGECAIADDDLQADMMLAASELLEAAGFERYEVASYAKPGLQSHHNTAYWTGAEYLGLGAGASSMLSPENAERALEAAIFEFDSEEAGRGMHKASFPKGTSFASPYTSESASGAFTRAQDCLSDCAPTQPPNVDGVARIRIAASADDVAFAESLGRPAVEVELLSARQSAVEDLMLGMRQSIGVSVEQVRAIEGAPAVFERLESLGLVCRRDGRLVPTERGWLLGNEVYGAIWSLAS